MACMAAGVSGKVICEDRFLSRVSVDAFLTLVVEPCLPISSSTGGVGSSGSWKSTVWGRKLRGVSYLYTAEGARTGNFNGRKETYRDTTKVVIVAAVGRLAGPPLVEDRLYASDEG